ncbi:hypothetical protein GGR51DRAFT_508769 [Nemania sp. FL0031]|nr:hypothetical protein GGR51DRAFT_508769 [Nemania sp. FL0031]
MSVPATSSILQPPATPSSPPSSPWAKRFPWKDTTTIVDGTTHSLLAPQYPKIEDPKYYDQQPDRGKDHNPKSNREIDYVLWGERVQERIFWGARTWQLAALNRRIMFSAEGDYIVIPGAQQPSLVTKVIDRIRRFSIGKSPLSSSGRSRESPAPHSSPQTPGTPAPRPQAPGTPASRPRIPGTPIPRPRIPSTRSRIPSLRSRRMATPSYRERPEFQFYEQQRIQVDDTKWYPFLRKERWFDWVQFSLETGESMPNRTWSVDDVQIWSALSVSLELTNRILRALVKDRHSGVSNLLPKSISYYFILSA